jgi:hypothetical protein
LIAATLALNELVAALIDADVLVEALAVYVLNEDVVTNEPVFITLPVATVTGNVEPSPLVKVITLLTADAVRSNEPVADGDCDAV